MVSAVTICNIRGVHQQKANLVLGIFKKGGKDDVLDDAAHYAFGNDGQDISRAGSVNLRE